VNLGDAATGDCGAATDCDDGMSGGLAGMVGV
jgi:hypothetical protein